MCRSFVCLIAVLSVCLGSAAARPVSAPPNNLEVLEQQSMKAAIARVAPSIVQIETTGGISVLQFGPLGATMRKGLGPTTGLVVAPDGYIISSAFNFASKPSAIFVALRGRKDRYVAKVVATDHTRMLTLLKIDATGLPVPTASPKKNFRVGQWALALGRTWSQNMSDPPSVSVGIISALDRIWGKAVQTDAKVSPVNYGGPLVDIEGRVMGVLVPASPRADNETAGVEWYDSGIGFAIPLEDINAVLPRLKKGDLNRGLLGVLLKGRDIYSEPAVIASVSPESTASRAGIQPGDQIVEIDGHRIEQQAQMRQALGAKYEGDRVSIKVRRHGKELAFANLQLTGQLTGFADPFMGIVPMRDDPELGVSIRYVYPKSPADTAGLKPGDRILSMGGTTGTPKPFAGRDQLLAMLNGILPGSKVKVEVRRKATPEKVDTITLKLASLPETVPAQIPQPSSVKKALVPPKQVAGRAGMPQRPRVQKPAAKKAETGFLRRSNATHDHEYWIYVPENYDPNIAHALVVWLHPPRRGLSKKAFEDGQQDFADKWADACADQHMILLGPRADNDTGWLLSESEFIQQAIREVMSQYTIDRQRVVAHGSGQGGQLAFYLAFHARDLVRGVAASGAALVTPIRENVPSQRLAFFVVDGAKDPAAKSVADTVKKLRGNKFPVFYHEFPNRGNEYLGDEEVAMPELVRWIDSLDRL